MRFAVCAVWLLATLGLGAREVAFLPGERWWGAANSFGRQMPFDEKSDLVIDLRASNYDNQCAPLLISDKGRVIWTEAQCAFAFKKGSVDVDSPAEVSVERPGTDLPSAYRLAMRAHFPASGKMPDPLFFSAPQLNTWIELTYHQNEQGIIDYAKSMVSNGVPPGVLMVDDTWQAGYGDWRFDPTRFTDPVRMMDWLHAQGFKVMLWMCPYVNTNLPAFQCVREGVFRTASGGVPQEREWWNGRSAFLDFSSPVARRWFGETLDGLVRDFGVDGFKLDGGDLSAYELSTGVAADPQTTNGRLNNGYADFARRAPYCELRNLWRCQQIPVVVRLHDKPHVWESLPRIVADMIAAGLLGYPYICPDMVGGGEWTSFQPGKAFDPELFLRSAQVHALCPMMQISASPWRVLSPEHQEIFRRIVALRQKFVPSFVKLAERAAVDGEPILRALEYNHPGMGYADIKDEFMMGMDLLVAPVLAKGVRSRSVVLPSGHWVADDGAEYDGPATVDVLVPLDRLPHFRRVADVPRRVGQ